MKVIVVIPAYNEQARIAEVVRQAQKYAQIVIVVDDCSSDGTSLAVREMDGNVIVLRHKVNLGKGSALKTGCEAARRLGADIIVLMDADGQHRAEDIPSLVHKLEYDKLSIVFGCRHIGMDMPLMMMLGNKFLSIATSLLFHIYVSDTQSGFRAFKTSVFESIKWNSTRYSVETEMIANTAKAGLAWGEADISTIYHDKHKGTTIVDGIRIFINMLVWKFL